MTERRSTRLPQRSVESDGNISDNIADPSVDQSVYITPGDVRRESYRLCTYEHFPNTRLIHRKFLAKSGFYFTGFYDRVKCFACGRTVDQWEETDNPEDLKWHKPQCAFVRGEECGNVAVQCIFRAIRTPTTANFEMSQLEQRTSFTSPQMGLVSTEHQNTPQSNNPQIEEQRKRKYPLRSPANPSMRGESARLGTFDHRWPMGRIRATPAEIAKAGFFFLGERDQVKCWYCDGGVHSWEPDDVPWVEHARLFPACEFLLRAKGQGILQRRLTLDPLLPQPTNSRLDRPTDTAQNMTEEQNAPGLPSMPLTLYLKEADSEEETGKRRERIQNIMKTSEIVKGVLDMGFDEKVVATLLENRILVGFEVNPNDIYGSSFHLVEDVIRKEEELKKQEEEKRKLDRDAKRLRDAEEKIESLQSSLEKLKESLKCKICFANPADTVFVPCGHLCCCMACATAIRSCPMCRMKIDRKMKTYIS